MRIQWSIVVGALIMVGVLGVTAVNVRGIAAQAGPPVYLPFVANQFGLPTPTATATPTPSQTATATPTPTQTPGSSVSAVDFIFQPKSLHVSIGTTVVWTNNTMSNTTHNVTADGGAFNSDLNPGAMFSFKFMSAGTFNYHCRFHGGPGGQGMSGSIVVGP